MSFDPIALIERAYEPHCSTRGWLAWAIEEVVQAIDPGCLAALSYVHGSSGPEEPIVVRKTASLDVQQARNLIETGFVTGTVEEGRKVAAACRKPGIDSLRRIPGDASMERWLLRRDERPAPFRDAVAVMLTGAEGKSMVLTLACAQVRPVLEFEQALWHRIAIHWSAGLRLADRPPGANAADVEAVVSPEGKVVHASGPAATAQGRDTLGRATRDIERARSRNGRSDPLVALELWQGLLAGRWSIVEHLDTDGRRLMLARKNDPSWPDPQALTRRQRQVVFYASLGMSNKEMAYALGLAENTISAHLSAGLSRLGLDSRTELVRLGTALASAAERVLVRSAKSAPG